MTQEVVAQACAVAGAFNDAGDIRHNEADALIHPHNAQVGIESGEVIVCDLGLGLGDNGEKRRLAHVGEADETHVRQELQLQHHVLKTKFFSQKIPICVVC